MAKIYAGRAARSIGGTPVVYKIIPMGDIECIDDRKGASVYHCQWAFVDKPVWVK